MIHQRGFPDVPEDVVLAVFSMLEEDPRDWARLACVCTKFSSLIRNICCKNKCSAAIPSVVSDLLPPAVAVAASSSSPSPPGGWASLHKLSVCCPGLFHAGVLLEYSDFGFDRELGPDEGFRRSASFPSASPSSALKANHSSAEASTLAAASNCSWSVLGDLYLDTLHGVGETPAAGTGAKEGVSVGGAAAGSWGRSRGRMRRCEGSHPASGARNLRREQGNKLLASRFRGDSLYICDWPGCIHVGEKRKYMLFRGIFTNFKRSRVRRAIRDAGRGKTDLGCAFCSAGYTWDLLSAFCLRRGADFHDDGEPVVRAYVCENGHVSGAWTDLSLYT